LKPPDILKGIEEPLKIPTADPLSEKAHDRASFGKRVTVKRISITFSPLTGAGAIHPVPGLAGRDYIVSLGGLHSKVCIEYLAPLRDPGPPLLHFFLPPKPLSTLKLHWKDARYLYF